MQTSRQHLSHINPFLKIGLGFGLIALSLFLKQIVPILVLVGGVLLLVPLLRLPAIAYLYALLTVTVFTLGSALLLQNWSEALFSALRLLAILLPMPVFALTTPPADLIRSLQATGLPNFVTLSLMLIWRFFPLMQQELQRIWEANQLRGVDLKVRPQLWFSGLMVPLVFQMVVYADEVTIGLQTRGYSPAEPRSNSKPMRWRWADTVFSLVVSLWLGTIAYLEWGR